MADFTTSQIGGPKGSPVSPQSPVTDNSDAVGLSAIGNIISSLGQAVPHYVAQKAQNDKIERENTKNTILSDFAQKQLKVADALETGEITNSAQARMIMRKNLSDYLGNNPALGKELVQMHAETLNKTRLGTAAYEGTEQEQQQRQIDKDMLSKGWMQPDWPEDRKEAARNAYFDYTQELTKMESLQKRLQLESSQVGLQRAKIGLQKDVVGLSTAKIANSTAGITNQTAALNLQQKQLAVGAQQALGNIQGPISVKLGNDFETFREAVAQNKMTPENAVMGINQKLSEVRIATSKLSANAGGEYVNALIKPLEEMAKNYTDYVTGKIKLETLNNQNALTTAKVTAQIGQDPKGAVMIATGHLFPNAQMMLAGQINETVKDLYKRADANKPIDLVPDYDEDKKDMANYLSILKDNAVAANTGKLSGPQGQPVIDNLNQHFSSVLRGIHVYQGAATDASQYAHIIDYLGDPAVNKYSVTHGGAVDETAKRQALDVIRYQYDNSLIPLIRDEWAKSGVGGIVEEDPRIADLTMAKVKPTKDLIQPEFVGSGVTFKAAPGTTHRPTLDRVRYLNKNVSPLLNKMITAQATLEGSSDIKVVYEKSFKEQLFGATGVNADQKQAGD